MWNTFQYVREHLSGQYSRLEIDYESGLPESEVRILMEQYWIQHVNEPSISRRAGLLALVLNHVRIGVDPADWFADHCEGTKLMLEFRSRFRTEAEELLPSGIIEKAELISTCGAGHAQLDLSHTSPDWADILQYGPAGLRDRAQKAGQQSSTPESVIFFDAVACVFDAMCRFIARLAGQARKVNAVRVINALETLAVEPPQTFHQALQLAYLYNQVQEMEGELVRAMGSFDQLFISYYRNDLAAGRLTRDHAKELIQFFCLKFFAQKQAIGKNICLGGMYSDGGDAANELSMLFYEAYREMHTYDPKISLRVHPGTPNELLLAATDCLKQGLTATVFANDEVAFEMFRKQGKEENDLERFVLIGCYEPAIMGKEVSCSMAAQINLAKPVELIFAQGRDPLSGIDIGLNEQLPESYEEFEAAYFRQLKHLLDRVISIVREFERIWSKWNPSPLLSGTMATCIAAGQDISAGGTTYNTSGIVCAGLASAVDSLAAVKKVVYEDCRCSLSELQSALASDWKNAPELLLAARRAPKWGNHDPITDSIGQHITSECAAWINSASNSRGGHFQMGLWSIDLNMSLGRRTGTLPDGKRNQQMLSKNLCSVIGMDKAGATALINSAATLNHTEFPNGSVLDVMLHPSVIAGADGAEILAALIRSYFAMGGLAIQFNIFNVETLKAAQRHPEQYRQLQVRVCGWNIRFIDLDPASQAAFIAQAEEIA